MSQSSGKESATKLEILGWLCHDPNLARKPPRYCILWCQIGLRLSSLRFTIQVGHCSPAAPSLGEVSGLLAPWQGLLGTVNVSQRVPPYLLGHLQWWQWSPTNFAVTLSSTECVSISQINVKTLALRSSKQDADPVAPYVQFLEFLLGSIKYLSIYLSIYLSSDQQLHCLVHSHCPLQHLFRHNFTPNIPAMCTNPASNRQIKLATNGAFGS